jgi:hypothetical protein
VTSHIKEKVNPAYRPFFFFWRTEVDAWKVIDFLCHLKWDCLCRLPFPGKGLHTCLPHCFCPSWKTMTLFNKMGCHLTAIWPLPFTWEGNLLGMDLSYGSQWLRVVQMASSIVRPTSLLYELVPGHFSHL